MAGNNDFLDSVIKNNNVKPVDAPHEQKNARTESKLTEKDELEEKARERDEDLRDHFHEWFKTVLSVMCIVFMIIVGVLVLHWILPEKCHWLDEKQLDNLKNIALAVFASNAISAWMSKIR